MPSPSRFRLALACGCLLAAAPALASPADAIKVRKDGFHQIGAGFKAVRDGASADPIDGAAVKAGAARIAAAAKQLSGWFPAGSGPESGVKTGAKAEIWSQPAKFKQAQDAFVAEANAFLATANGGDAAAIRAGMAKLGGTCKGCHDSFRAADQH